MPALTYVTSDEAFWTSLSATGKEDDNTTVVPHIESDGALTPALISDRTLAKDEGTAARVRLFARAWAEYRAMVGQTPEERAGKQLEPAVDWGYEGRTRPPSVGDAMRRQIHPPKGW